MVLLGEILLGSTFKTVDNAATTAALSED